jgi:PKHD-type hydroxylase
MGFPWVLSDSGRGVTTSELVLALDGGERRFRLPPGQAVFYPSGTTHWVEPVRSGCRVAAVGWMRSHVPEPSTRAALADFSRTIDELRASGAPDAPLVRLSELYSTFTRAAMR